jgi:hypothetical protein
LHGKVDRYGQYWLSIRFVWFKAGGLIFWTTLFGLVIFPRFWRSRSVGRTMGNWITMKKTPLVSKKRLMLLGALVLGLALFVLLDVPQTVRMKALVINMLPLDAQTKVDTVENLCLAAFAGSSSSGSLDCFRVNYSATASAEVTRRRTEIAEHTLRREKCAEFKQRMTKGALQADWDTTTNNEFYSYIGSDPHYTWIGPR